MEQDNFLAKLRDQDPSWTIAQSLVDKHLKITPQQWSFFRSSWGGHLTDRDFIKMLGFSRLNPICLISAADLIGEAADPDISLVEQALNILGLRYSCIVLAARYCCYVLTQVNPNVNWKPRFQSLIDHIEIGYHFGLKSGMLGSEGGALMGFAASIPSLVITSENPTSAKNIAKSANTAESIKLELEAFGCQKYQIGAFVLQKFGFGTHAALGVALALGKFRTKSVGQEDPSIPWKAALLWIEALLAGRNFPAEIDMRTFFTRLSPPKDGQQKNPILDSLYTEIAKIRSQGSSWKWHLPKDFVEK
jgi:hypothetical protein